MTDLRELSLSELEELAARLRHAVARNPEKSQQERIELADLNQWISLRQQQTENGHSPDADTPHNTR